MKLSDRQPTWRWWRRSEMLFNISNIWWQKFSRWLKWFMLHTSIHTYMYTKSKKENLESREQHNWARKKDNFLNRNIGLDLLAYELASLHRASFLRQFMVFFCGRRCFFSFFVLNSLCSTMLVYRSFHIFFSLSF